MESGVYVSIPLVRRPQVLVLATHSLRLRPNRQWRVCRRGWLLLVMVVVVVVMAVFVVGGGGGCCWGLMMVVVGGFGGGCW